MHRRCKAFSPCSLKRIGPVIISMPLPQEKNLVSSVHRHRMGGTIITAQNGLVDLNKNGINLPSLLLGVVLVGSCYLIFKFRINCQNWRTSHLSQSNAMESMARSLALVTSGGPQVTVSKIDPLYQKVLKIVHFSLSDFPSWCF